MGVAAPQLEQATAQLAAAGLVVEVQRDDAEEFRLLCWRPSAVPGNRRDGWALPVQTDAGVDVLDAPVVLVLWAAARPGWLVRPAVTFGGFGPKPWDREVGSLTDAAVAVLDYYFGDPEWAQRPRRQPDAEPSAAADPGHP